MGIIMTPKENAEKLVYKYYQLSFDILHTDCEGDKAIASGTPTMFNAKQCAVIAVQSIIDVLNSDLIIYGSEYRNEASEYWQQVKTEIELL